MSAPEDVDAVVIGASMRGLVTATILGGLGLRTVLVDRSPRIGGSDGSFTTEGGAVFDHGMHVLDVDRSPVATRLFLGAVDGRAHRSVLRRGIVLRGHVLPYAPAVDDLPDDLRALLRLGPLVDDIGGASPTRTRLAACYGEGFADLILDEVLPSFPAEARHLAFGVDEARLLVNIYPWFFPRATRRGAVTDESRAFHEQLRAGVPQEVLAPPDGFGAFAQGFASKLPGLGVDVLTAAEDLTITLEPGSHDVASVRAGGRELRARHHFWCAGWPQLCDLLAIDCIDAATDRVWLGSFRLDRPPLGPHQELLVGDPSFALNRVHLPGRFRGTDEPLVQVELAVPDADPAWQREPDEWRVRWVDDLRRLGVLDGAHQVVEHDVRSFRMHFNGFGVEGEPLRDADPTLVRSANLHPVVPSLANLNVNRWVPRAVRDVTAVVAGA